MKCPAVYRFICEHLDEKSNSPRFKAVREHLAKCEPCQRFLTSMKKTVQLYCAEPDLDVPRQAHAKLMKALKDEQTRQP